VARARDAKIVESYAKTVDALKKDGFRVYEIAMETSARSSSPTRARKNMFRWGCSARSTASISSSRPTDRAHFGKKDQK